MSKTSTNGTEDINSSSSEDEVDSENSSTLSLLDMDSQEVQWGGVGDTLGQLSEHSNRHQRASCDTLSEVSTYFIIHIRRGSFAVCLSAFVPHMRAF